MAVVSDELWGLNSTAHCFFCGGCAKVINCLCRCSSGVEYSIRNRTVVGSNPTIGSGFQRFSVMADAVLSQNCLENAAKSPRNPRQRFGESVPKMGHFSLLLSRDRFCFSLFRLFLKQVWLTLQSSKSPKFKN